MRRLAPVQALLLIVGLGAVLLGPGPLALSTLAAGDAFEVLPLRTSLILSPGQTHTGALEIRNTGVTPLRLQAFSYDWYLTVEGVPQFPWAGEIPPEREGWLGHRSLARAMIISPAVLDLLPGENGYFRYTFTVPEGAAALWGAIMVESVGPPSGRPGGGGATLAFQQRYASLIYVNSPGAIPDLGLRGLSIRLAEGRLHLIADFENRGSAICRAVGAASLLDSGGQPVRPDQRFDFPVLPESSRRFTVDLGPAPPAGSYAAQIVFDFGGVELRGGRKRFGLRQVDGAWQVAAP